MNLNHLRVFSEVARARSLTRAARSLRVSQPAVSKQLADLEADLGAHLFDRLPRGVRLTAAGEVLYEHAQRILGAEQAAEAELRDMAQLRRGRLSIGASTTIGSYLIPSLFGELHRAHPKVELQLQIANTAVVQAAVLDNTLDLGLTEGFVSSEALTTEVVAHDEMVVIAAPGHAALRNSSLHARDLRELPVLMRERGSGTRDVVEAALRTLGVEIVPIMALGSTEALKNAVLHGLGIAIVSRLTVEQELHTGRVHEVRVSDLHIRRDLHLVTLKGKQLSRPMAAFVEVLHKRQRALSSPPRGDAYVI
jgi:DNA-binding transcriptional LysR family regulator